MKLSRANGDAATTLQEAGCVLLQPDELAAECHVQLEQLGRLAPSWNQLPRDAYLRDGGRYRSRRHSCFIYEPAQPLQPVPHRAHWQPTEYNALHGGMERWFDPMTSDVLLAPCGINSSADSPSCSHAHGPCSVGISRHISFGIDTARASAGQRPKVRIGTASFTSPDLG